MNISQLGCCAVSELRHISTPRRTPEQVMKDFCTQTWVRREYDYSYRDRSHDKPSAFYIFTGVVRQRGLRQPTYGQDFAAFIIANRLGDVVESPARANRVNHPSHQVKVWVWAPDERRLRAWWKANGGA